MSSQAPHVLYYKNVALSKNSLALTKQHQIKQLLLMWLAWGPMNI